MLPRELSEPEYLCTLLLYLFSRRVLFLVMVLSHSESKIVKEKNHAD